jgi:hypothetical protein
MNNLATCKCNGEYELNEKFKQKKNQFFLFKLKNGHVSLKSKSMENKVSL